MILLIEIISLTLSAFLPREMNSAANSLVSFSCAMQVQSFRKADGYPYASTMCIGNLRSGTESLSVYLREKQVGALKKAMHYYGIILIFAVGAGIGGVCSLAVGTKAIWVSSVLLLVVFFLMHKEHR